MYTMINVHILIMNIDLIISPRHYIKNETTMANTTDANTQVHDRHFLKQFLVLTLTTYSIFSIESIVYILVFVQYLNRNECCCII